MPDVTLPTPDEVVVMREAHVDNRTTWDYLRSCEACGQRWPCDAARLLALMDAMTARLDAVLAALGRPALSMARALDRIRRAATREG